MTTINIDFVSLFIALLTTSLITKLFVEPLVDFIKRHYFARKEQLTKIVVDAARKR